MARRNLLSLRLHLVYNVSYSRGILPDHLLITFELFNALSLHLGPVHSRVAYAGPCEYLIRIQFRLASDPCMHGIDQRVLLLCEGPWMLVNGLTKVVFVVWVTFLCLESLLLGVPELILRVHSVDRHIKIFLVLRHEIGHFAINLGVWCPWRWAPPAARSCTSPCRPTTHYARRGSPTAKL